MYLGSIYVNDFNRFGRTYQVNCRPSRIPSADGADPAARNAEDHGGMVPLGSLVTVRAATTDQLSYNGYPAAEITADPRRV